MKQAGETGPSTNQICLIAMDWWIVETSGQLYQNPREKLPLKERSAKLSAAYLLRYGHKTEVLKGNSIDRPLNDVTGVYP